MIDDFDYLLSDLDLDCLEIARAIADKGAEHLVSSLDHIGITVRIFRDKEDRYFLYVEDTCLALSDMGHPVESIDELYGRAVEMFVRDPIEA